MSKNSILDVLAEYWPDRLSKRTKGRIVHVRCLCDNHPDRNPSVAVYNQEERFKCFSLNCPHKGGIREVINLIKNHLERNGQPVPPALLSDRSDPQDKTPKEQDRVNTILYASTPPYLADLIGRACAFYAKTMWEQAEGRRYLIGRGLREETMRLMHVGWCPDCINAEVLIKTLDADVIHLAAAGLINSRGNAVFAGRVVFPIGLNSSGSANYAVGRTIYAEKEPRYLGLGSSLAVRRPYRIGTPRHGVILVEGILDAAALIQAGLTDDFAVIALLGGGSEREWLLLTRWLREHQLPIVVMLDRDPSGTKMTANIVDLMTSKGIKTYSWHARDAVYSHGRPPSPLFEPLIIKCPEHAKDLGDLMITNSEDAVREAIYAQMGICSSSHNSVFIETNCG